MALMLLHKANGMAASERLNYNVCTGSNELELPKAAPTVPAVGMLLHCKERPEPSHHTNSLANPYVNCSAEATLSMHRDMLRQD